MKTIYFVLIALLMASCGQEEEDILYDNPEEIAAILPLLEEEILTLLDGSCDASGQCKAIAFGFKACGGPRSYLIYGSSTNEASLKNLVAEYNALEEAYVKAEELASTCDFISPPELTCADGQCIVINE